MAAPSDSSATATTAARKHSYFAIHTPAPSPRKNLVEKQNKTRAPKKKVKSETKFGFWFFQPFSSPKKTLSLKKKRKRKHVSSTAILPSFGHSFHFFYNSKSLSKSIFARLVFTQKLERKKKKHFSFSSLELKSLRKKNLPFDFFQEKKLILVSLFSPSKDRPVPVRAAAVLALRRRDQHDLQRPGAQPSRRAVARGLREPAARQRRRRRRGGDGG